MIRHQAKALLKKVEPLCHPSFAKSSYATDNINSYLPVVQLGTLLHRKVTDPGAALCNWTHQYF